MNPLPQAVVWFVSAVLIEAAVIDGLKLRVPNWLTYNLFFAGLGFAAYSGGLMGLLWAVAGAALGLSLLLPLYAIGGMGAGDVKLMAGLGAWMGPALTLGAFAASGIAGGIIALVMVVRSGTVLKHVVMAQMIGQEILSVRDPAKLAESAARRKPTMMLLPYAIPIAIGSIAYFAWMGLYV